MAEDIQVAVIHVRPTSPDFGSAILELGGGEGNVVELVAVHWHQETFGGGTNWTSLALSSNPEHLATPPPAIAEFQADVALYGRGTFVSLIVAGSGVGTEHTIVVPLYGLIRPRKQVFVWGLINGSAIIGLTGEVYYRPVVMAKVDRDAVNRKYGKYRRS